MKLHTRTNTLIPFHRMLPLRVSLIVIMSVLTAFQSYSIGLKLVREYPQTLLAAAKTWDIETFDDNWTFFATQDGIIQYDGSHASLFHLNNRYPVRSVFMDRRQGRLYAGGINEFGYFTPSAATSLEYVCLSDSIGDDRNVGNIWGIYRSGDIVMVQGDTQLLVYDEKTGAHRLIKADCKLDCSVLIDGVLWLGTDNGLKFLLGNSLSDAFNADILKGSRIRKILPFRNTMVIVTASDGVFQYNRSRLTRLSAVSDAAARLGEVFSADLRDNTLVLGGVDNGVGVVDMTSGSMTVYDEQNGLPNNTALAVKFDSRGDLWAGLDFCVAKIEMKTPVETFNNKALPIGSGYVMQTVGDRMYLGTNRGLYHVDFLPGADLSRSEFHKVDGIHGQVWGLSVVGNTLFCCGDRGIFTVAGGSAGRVGDISGVWDVQRSLRDSLEAYAGTYSGMAVFRSSGGRWTFDRMLEGSVTSFYNFEQESKSVIWSRDGENGLFRMHLDGDARRIVRIENFKATADGTPLTSGAAVSRIDNDIYVATREGIYRYDSRRGAFAKDERMSLLLGSPRNVRRLKKSGGWLYALTDKEIIQGDPAGKKGVHRIPLEKGEGAVMHDGNLLFSVNPGYLAYPTRYGFAFFDFSEKPASGDSQLAQNARHARISRFAVTVPKDSTLYSGNFMQKKDPIVIPYSQNSIAVEFGADGAPIIGTRYSCRLNNGKWSEPSTSTVKEFTGLSEGKYRFEVKAVEVDGTESVDFIEFEVLPPWWRSVWAMIGYGLMVCLAIWGTLLLEKRKLRRQEAELTLEKERELAVQQARFEWESKEKDHKIVELENEKLDKELRHKAQEMASAMMNLAHKNETLLTVKRDLQQIRDMLPRSSADARKAIADLQGKVSVDIKSDDTLNRIETEFDIVHNDFIKRLRARYPDISNNEVLMCAYLKMNLSTKEIAPLLNISVRGVETMRYRIRRKFELDRETNLSEFLRGENLA